MSGHVWRWELSLAQVWHGHTVWVPPPNGRRPVTVEVAAFRDGEHVPLENGLLLQFGVSDTARTIDMRNLREAQPGLPITGDRRSGTILLDGDQIVASYVIDGARTYESHRLAVRPDHQRRGLGTRLVLEWYKRAMVPRHIDSQRMNLMSAKSFLVCNREICLWAKAEGKVLPERVLQEMETHAEEARIVEALRTVERTGQPVTFGG